MSDTLRKMSVNNDFLSFHNVFVTQLREDIKSLLRFFRRILIRCKTFYSIATETKRRRIDGEREVNVSHRSPFEKRRAVPWAVETLQIIAIDSA